MTNYFTKKIKYHNLLHSILLLGGMLALAIVIGYLFAGMEGVLITTFMCILIFSITPKLPSSLILSMYGAQRLDHGFSPQLYEMLNYLIQKSDLDKTPTLYYLPSSLLNSFSIGHTDNASIILSDGLLRELNSQELFGVLAHEVSHLENDDLWVMNIADIISRVTALLSLFGLLMLISYMPLILLSDGGLPWLLILILMFAPNVSALMQLALSRTREFEADQNAAKLTGDALGLASALRKIEIIQSSMIKKVLFPGYRLSEPSLLRTHPPSEARINRLMTIAQRQPDYPHTLINHMPHHLIANRVKKPHHRFHGLWY